MNDEISPKTLDAVFQPAKSEELYIVVHPYFVDLESQSTPEKQKYLANIEKLISSYEGPILTNEDASKIDRTVERYRRLNCRGLRYFIPTYSWQAQPKNTDGPGFARWIVKTFEPKKILIAGANLSVHEGSYGQCVGSTYESLKLRLPKTEIGLDFENVHMLCLD